MNNIEALIQQYCPNGVEYMPLGKVCGFISGFAFKASLFHKEGEPVCKTTNIQQDAIDFSNMECFHIEDYDTCLDRYVVMPQDIVIGMSGTIKVGINNSNKKCYLNQRVGKFNPNVRFLNNKYLYYVLLNSTDTLCEGITGGSVKNLSNNDITAFEIPIPPLPVQEEIVRVLDTFTELQAELQAELQKRKKQYSEIREGLIGQHRLCDRVFLDDLFPFIRNGFVGTIKPYFTQDTLNGIRYLEGTNIHNGKISDNEVMYVTRDFHNKHIKNELKADDILMVQSGHIGECAVVGEKYKGANCHALIIMSNGGRANPQYVVHYFHTYEGFKALTPAITGGTVKHVLAGKMGKISIPLPSLDEQNRVVSILDRFEALTNDLAAGLPAEIEKRRQQYEFYRDKLLTFKRKEA